LKILADCPSRKSKISAPVSIHAAVSNSPLIIKIMAINPDARFNRVIKLGICFFI
jgi:hypothetical protein